jgi:hypothetical protein
VVVVRVFQEACPSRRLDFVQLIRIRCSCSPESPIYLSFADCLRFSDESFYAVLLRRAIGQTVGTEFPLYKDVDASSGRAMRRDGGSCQRTE